MEESGKSMHKGNFKCTDMRESPENQHSPELVPKDILG